MNQYAASRACTWANVMFETVPVPFVVLSTVVLWITTGTPSEVICRSRSSIDTPALAAWPNAYNVECGFSSSPPACAKATTRRVSHGLDGPGGGDATLEGAAPTAAASNNTPASNEAPT